MTKVITLAVYNRRKEMKKRPCNDDGNIYMVRTFATFLQSAFFKASG